MAVQADGKVLLGGQFTALRPNGAPSPTARSNFARLHNDPATQTLTAPDTTQVLWTRAGAGPELSGVTFASSTNGGATWTALPGAATRVSATASWQLSGLSLPTRGQLRARGRTTGGYSNGSSGLIEQVAAFDFAPPDVTPPETAITSGPSGRVMSTSATFTYTADEPATFSYRLDGGAPATGAGPVTFDSLAPGAHTFSVTATDPARNADATPATRSWTVQLDPSAETLFAKGSPVPGAGTRGGTPAGAVFASFGVPAINDVGAVAFLGQWESPTGSGAGLFAGKPAVLAVKVGDTAFAGVPFAAFKDPVLGADGRIAFSASLAGPGITAANNTALFTQVPGGAATLVAQEGAVADAADGATLKSFTSLSLQGAEVLYTATLQAGTPVVTSANNRAAFRATAAGTTPVVREGQAFGATAVQSFKLVAAVSGSPGQNRAHTEGRAAFLVLLADGTQALVDAADGTLTAFARTGQLTGGALLPSATWKSFGPVAAPDATYAAMRSTLTSGVGGVTSANAKGIFLGTGSAFEPVARVTGATGIAGASFSAFKDPVLAPGTGAVAFPATIEGAGAVTSADDATLWWQPAGGALTLLARESAEPAETGAGVKWKAFKSLAIAGAPLFHATLRQGSSGVDATNDAGLWAVDSAGALRLLVREGDAIGGRTVKTFTALNGVPGSPGVTRSFNHAGQVIYRATFTDGSQSLVLVQMP